MSKTMEPGYYWMAVKGEEPPRIIAVIVGPRGNGIMYVGMSGNFGPPRKPHAFTGPLAIPPQPTKWPKQAAKERR